MKKRKKISILLLGFFLFFLFILSIGVISVSAADPNSLESEPINIPTTDWADKLFGGPITLKIFNPTKIEGEAGLWSVFSILFAALFPISFIVSIAAIAFGSIKMSMSQGDQAKLENGKKWFVNGVVGFISTVVFLLISNVILTILGIGTILDLAQNFAVCGEQTMYQYKKDSNQLDKGICECLGTSWGTCKEIGESVEVPDAPEVPTN